MPLNGYFIPCPNLILVKSTKFKVSALPYWINGASWRPVIFRTDSKNEK